MSFSRPSFVLSSALALMILVPSVCWAVDQTGSAAEIGAVTASSTNDEVVVEIQVKGIVTRTLFSELNGPSRLVIDFHGAHPSTGSHKTAIGQGPLVAARTALFGTDQDNNPVTRVVLDLAGPTKFERRPEEGKLVLSTKLNSTAAPVAVVKASKKDASASLRALSQESIVAVRQLEEMSVSPAGGKTTVNLRFDQAVKPVISVLSDPKRYVVDFPVTQFGAEWKHSGTFNLSTGPVSSIRAGKFKMNPPVVRLVFDQAENAPRPTLVANDRMLTLVFDEGVGGSQATRSATQETVAPELNEAMTSAASSALQITKKAHAPFVSYDRGMLFVDADNSNLPDILYAISQKTGAEIELPMAEGMLDRVGTRIGPAPPREVIAKLLDGSIYNYIIVESSAGKIDEVLLSAKQPEAPAK
jgi:hypothetical protein